MMTFWSTGAINMKTTQCTMASPCSFTPTLRKDVIWEYFTENEEFILSSLKCQGILSMLSTFPRPHLLQKDPRGKTLLARSDSSGMRTSDYTAEKATLGKPQPPYFHVNTGARGCGRRGGAAPTPTSHTYHFLSPTRPRPRLDSHFCCWCLQNPDVVIQNDSDVWYVSPLLPSDLITCPLDQFLQLFSMFPFHCPKPTELSLTCLPTLSFQFYHLRSTQALSPLQHLQQVLQPLEQCLLPPTPPPGNLTGVVPVWTILPLEPGT